jgi:hypothetical protein
MQDGAPSAAQADDPCQTPNLAPTFLPRDSRSTPQPTRTPLPYDPCVPTATRSTSATGFASTPTPALPPVIPTPQLAANGLFGRYFTDALSTTGSFDSFHATRLDPRLDFFWQQPAKPGIPDLGDCFSVRWTARLKTALTGNYLFYVNHDDGVRLWVNNQLLVDKWQDNLFNNAHSGEISLEANQAYPIRVELYQNCAGPAGIRLYWRPPGQGSFSVVPSTQFLPELTPDTVAVYRPSDQTFYLRYHNTTGFSDEAILYGNPGDIPLVGDWNGDGLDEIGVYRPSTAQWFLRGRDGQTHSLVFGAVGDIPLVGKWNRLSNLTVNNKPYLSDGLGVFRPSTNTFHFRQTLSTGVADYSLSVAGDFAIQPSDMPVVGDWDGDGIETLGFYRPTNQRWYLSHAKPALGGSATFPTTIHFGEAEGLPFTGDWLGRGSHLLGSLQAGFVEHENVGLAYTGWQDGGTQFFYGSTGDLPLAGKWIARCANGELPLPSVGCTILQALPTNTRRPTRTPEPTGTPTVCNIRRINANIFFRFQPALDTENYLFVIQSGYSPFNAGSFPSPTRLWLWDEGTTQTQATTPFTIQTIVAVARVGAVSWVDQSTDWIQVQLIGTSISNSPVLTGYISSAFVDSDANCMQTLPIPSQGIANRVNPVQFNIFNVASLFNGYQPPSYMGSCGLHDKTNCVSGSGATLDIVPRNVEMCFDTRTVERLSECNPGSQGGTPSNMEIPIYAPAAGCANFDENSSTVVIDIDRVNCTDPPLDTNREIVITHIKGGFSGYVNPGVQIGTMCRYENRQICGIDTDPSQTQNTPSHIAFQLRLRNLTKPTNAFQEVIGFLARPNCIYDDWIFNQFTNPQRIYNASFAACP